MNTAIFSTKTYDRQFLQAASAGRHDLTFFTPRLTDETLPLAAGFQAVCVFVQDELSARMLERLAAGGLRAVVLRCAGFNNVDLVAAQRLGIRVARVPAYSPNAVAEHAAALMLALNRHLHKAYARTREGNFALEGLIGFDFNGKTAGIVGTGKIGFCLARIMTGLGCRVLGYDVRPNVECQEIGVRFVSLEELYAESDVISLHCPLTPETHHLINAAAIDRMKHGVMLINTSRGAVVDTRAVIEALKCGKIGAVGLDVYEEEADLFFEDLSNRVLQDDVLARLLTFPNVIVTGHQAFFTREALDGIARTTMANLTALETGEACANELLVRR